MPVWMPGDPPAGYVWSVSLAVRDQRNDENDAVSTYSASTAAVPLTTADRDRLYEICRTAHHAMMRVFEEAWTRQLAPRATVGRG